MNILNSQIKVYESIKILSILRFIESTINTINFLMPIHLVQNLFYLTNCRYLDDNLNLMIEHTSKLTAKAEFVVIWRQKPNRFCCTQFGNVCSDFYNQFILMKIFSWKYYEIDENKLLKSYWKVYIKDGIMRSGNIRKVICKEIIE